MAAPQVTNLPTAPSRSDSPDVFAQRADAFVAALVGWNASINDATDWANTTFISLDNAETNAVNAADEALQYRNTTEGYKNTIETSYLDFNSEWLGDKTGDPSLDNNGNPVTAGTTYFNTTLNRMRIYNGSDWQDAVGAITGDFTVIRETLTATAGQTVFTLANQYTTGINALMIYVNGARVLDSDYTETDSNTITFTAGLNAGDEVLVEQGVTNAGDTTSAGLTTLNPVGTITSTNVQAAIGELNTDITAVKNSSISDFKSPEYSIQTNNFTAMSGAWYSLDASTAFTITLPATPSTGDAIEFFLVAGDASANNLTLTRNGQTIEGLTEDMIVDSNSPRGFRLYYTGTTWRVAQ